MLQEQTRHDSAGAVALACGIGGVVGAVVMYWMVVPGIVLGVAAVILGWRARSRGNRELGGVAIALGVVAVLLVPAVLMQTDAAEDWGRDCALDPDSDPNC